MYKKISTFKIIIPILILFIITTISANAIAQRNYINDTNQYTVDANSPQLKELSTNLTINDNINHTFETKVDGFFDYNVQYTSGNKSGFLLYLVFNGVASGNGDKIQKISCSDGFASAIFTGTDASTNFDNFHNFSVVFYASNTVEIFIDGVSKASTSVCTDFNDISSVNITSSSSAVINNNQLLADNMPPEFIGNLPNITWPEGTSTDFNIANNFSDSNGDILTYSYTALENITISINNDTGIVNLTPDPDFYGIGYVKFIADDGSNTTFSNNVTLNVTAVNDAPSITSATITNTDFLNRTNGSLTANWTFTDVDNSIMSGNETLWYINGIENETLRNLIAISSSNTTKNQNWSFSVRVFDGTDFSSFVTSENLTIDNALQVFNPELGVVSAEVNQLFTYDIDYTDLDKDIVAFHDNSTLFSITNEGIINFTPSTIGNITVNVTMSQNPNVSDILTIEVKDAMAPVITSIGKSYSGTTTVTVTLSVTTDETAICRFTTSNSNLNYSSMADQMSSTNSTSHSNSQSFTSDEAGTYYVRCNDTIGNVMNFSNSTAFNADVQEPVSDDGGSPGGGGGGGGGSGKYTCKLDWSCTPWTSCEDEKQTRKCKLEDVSAFRNLNRCPQHTIPEQERDCKIEVKVKETCSDGIQNQDEERIDCGGPCGPCFTIETEEEENIVEEPQATAPTGAVVAFLGNLGRNPLFLILLVILAGIFTYRRFRKKPPKNLSDKETERLNVMLNSETR